MPAIAPNSVGRVSGTVAVLWEMVDGRRPVDYVVGIVECVQQLPPLVVGLCLASHLVPWEVLVRVSFISAGGERLETSDDQFHEAFLHFSCTLYIVKRMIYSILSLYLLIYIYIYIKSWNFIDKSLHPSQFTINYVEPSQLINSIDIPSLIKKTNNNTKPNTLQYSK